jgi:hypothetical protein
MLSIFSVRALIKSDTRVNERSKVLKSPHLASQAAVIVFHRG